MGPISFYSYNFLTYRSLRNHVHASVLTHHQFHHACGHPLIGTANADFDQAPVTDKRNLAIVFVTAVSASALTT